ncbi:hypothetical protein [Streptomyces marincola]|nr:hypothetical protein [Streptomyces marincola]
MDRNAQAAAEAAKKAEEARRKAEEELRRHGQAMAGLTAPKGGGRK